ncbi:hypothetical protein J6590_107036 [Homalodisca vitripennis]|nr:hypothetical protein J6590_107036 [Homalodisca vitripennis]
MTARSNPSPFKIIPVQQHMIRDWTTFLKEQYKEKCPFATRPIREAKMLKDETELFYRPTYNEPRFSSDIRRPRSNIKLPHLQPGEFLYPDQAYQALLPISKEKFDDLRVLKHSVDKRPDNFFQHFLILTKKGNARDAEKEKRLYKI